MNKIVYCSIILGGKFFNIMFGTLSKSVDFLLFSFLNIFARSRYEVKKLLISFCWGLSDVKVLEKVTIVLLFIFSNRILFFITATCLLIIVLCPFLPKSSFWVCVFSKCDPNKLNLSIGSDIVKKLLLSVWSVEACMSALCIKCCFELWIFSVSIGNCFFWSK